MQQSATFPSPQALSPYQTFPKVRFLAASCAIFLRSAGEREFGVGATPPSSCLYGQGLRRRSACRAARDRGGRIRRFAIIAALYHRSAHCAIGRNFKLYDYPPQFRFAERFHPKKFRNNDKVYDNRYFGAGFLGCEHPFDWSPEALRCRSQAAISDRRLLVGGNAPVEALTAQHTDLDLDHGQPAGVFGCE